MMFPLEMMSASPNVYCKHRIIASERSNIIFAKQMHHITIGDISLKSSYPNHSDLPEKTTCFDKSFFQLYLPAASYIASQLYSAYAE